MIAGVPAQVRTNTSRVRVCRSGGKRQFSRHGGTTDNMKLKKGNCAVACTGIMVFTNFFIIRQMVQKLSWHWTQRHDTVSTSPFTCGKLEMQWEIRGTVRGPVFRRTVIPHWLRKHTEDCVYEASKITLPIRTLEVSRKHAYKCHLSSNYKPIRASF
jgi:hypothetical protein